MKRLFSGIVVLVLVAVACGGASASVSPPTPEESVDTTSPTPDVSTESPAPTVSPTPEPTITPSPDPEVWVDVYPVVSWTPPNPLNILILGSDGRSYDPKRCNFSGRADVIHLVSINPETREGTIMNFPRDSWVYVPPKGGYGRINEGLYYGGLEGMVSTVSRLTSMPIHYAAITTFCSLIQMVDAVGGITVRVPYDIGDSAVSFGCVWGADPGATQRCSRENIPENDTVEGSCDASNIIRAGVRHLNGCDVLKFARVRHGVPGGDFGRTTNQATILLAGLKRFRELASTPAGLLNVLQITKEHVRFSKECTNVVGILGCRDMIKLAFFARTIAPADIDSYTIRGYGDNINGASVVQLSSSNYAVFRDVKTDAVINGQ